MAEPDWTDAKFKVIKRPPRRRVGGGWWFDWRNFLILTAIAVAAFIGRLLAAPPS